MTSQIEQIELNIKQAKEFVELGAALNRLMNNRDFKKVVLDHYFRENAIRLVHLKADHTQQSPEDQAGLIQKMDAIGCFKHFLQTVEFQADQSAKAIEADEEMRQTLLEEELTNG